MTYKLEGIRHNQKFRAKINNQNTEGKISINKNGTVYFCTNNPELDGNCAFNKLGYSYSWEADEDVTALQIQKKGKWIQYKKVKMPIIFNHQISIDKNIFIVGCGAVKLTKKEIQDYIEGYKIIKKYPGFQKIQDVLYDYDLRMDNKNFNKLRNLLN